MGRDAVERGGSVSRVLVLGGEGILRMCSCAPRRLKDLAEVPGQKPFVGMVGVTNRLADRLFVETAEPLVESGTSNGFLGYQDHATVDKP